MMALTAPAAAPAITLTAVFFRVLVAPLVPLELLFLRPVGVPPDLLAPLRGAPDLEADFLCWVFAGILFLLVMVAVSGERPHVPTYAESRPLFWLSGFGASAPRCASGGARSKLTASDA
jgi:hypothetical protein